MNHSIYLIHGKFFHGMFTTGLWKRIASRSKKKDSYPNLSTAASESPVFSVDKELLGRSLIGRGSMTSLVAVPSGLSVNEWIATQTVLLFENINLLHGCLSEHCKPSTCPSMDGPGNIQYTWLDEKGKKCKMAACEYVDCITSYMHSCVQNEDTFPTKYGNDFPSNFRRIAENVHRLLCHILVHMHHSHLQHLVSLQLNPHYTTILHHFLSFNKIFQLANPSDLALFDHILTYLNAPIECYGGSGDEHNKNVVVDANDGSKVTDEGEVVYNESVVTNSSNTDAISLTENQNCDRGNSEGHNAEKQDVTNYVPLFTVVT